MSEDNLKQEKSTQGESNTNSYEYIAGVARDVVKLLAERNIQVNGVDWVFSIAKDIIGSMKLALPVEKKQEPSCPCTSHE